MIHGLEELGAHRFFGNVIGHETCCVSYSFGLTAAQDPLLDSEVVRVSLMALSEGSYKPNRRL